MSTSGPQHLDQSPMPEPHHHPPDMLSLLIETVPRLCRSKKDVIVFFAGAGVPRTMMRDLEDDLRANAGSHNKFDLTRTILVRLNDAGDRGLAARREVIKRVTEFEDFTRCWENDVLQAKGLVAEVRNLLNVKDSFTRMNIERTREREQARAAQLAESAARLRRRDAIEQVKREFYQLFSETDAHRRGKKLEGVLNRLFAAFGILVRESFTLRVSAAGVVEQIDGAIELDGYLYLVEMKWWSNALGPGETAQHLVRVFARDGARGLFISATGYTAAAVEQFRDALRQRVTVLCTLEEIVRLLDGEKDLPAALRRKVQIAVLDKKPLVEIG